MPPLFILVLFSGSAIASYKMAEYYDKSSAKTEKKTAEKAESRERTPKPLSDEPTSQTLTLALVLKGKELATVQAPTSLESLVTLLEKASYFLCSPDFNTTQFKLQQVEDYYAKWYEIHHEKMQPLLGDSDETRSIVETDRALHAVIEQFINEIRNPSIILASSGTTSGGKSSLVNLLCGAEIMPVQEMSAGTVVIEHHPTKRHLKIPHVEGLPAEKCGEWADLTNADILQRLQAFMVQYRQLSEENREPPAPRIEVQYPTRLGRRPELAGLPKGFKLRIIDLPGLKLAHLVKSVTDAADEALTNAHQIAHAHLNAAEERYQAECERLDRIGVDLQQLREESKQELWEIVNFSEEDNNESHDLLIDMAAQLQKKYELPDNSLVPLYDWMTELGNAVEKLFSSIYDAILEGKKPQGQFIESLPLREREALDQVLMHLQESGYGRYAKNGGYFDTASQGEKNQLRKMNESLNELAEVLVRNLKMLFERIVEREAERIQDALQIFTEKYAQFMSEKAQTIASDLAVAMTASKLVRVKRRLLFDFQLTAGFLIHQQQREDKIGEKMRWYTLGLMKKSVFEKRDYESAVIPSIMNIYNNFIVQAKASRPEAEFFRWLRDQLDEFLKGIDKDQEELLKKSRHRLEQATLEKEQNLAQWQQITDELARLRNQLSELSKGDY